MRKINKKAEGTPVWIIIALVLGLIVLVIIAVGFAGGWTKLFEKFRIFGGTTLSTIGQSCQVACAANDKTVYCFESRTVTGLTQQQVNTLKGTNTTLPVPDVADKEAIVICKDLADKNFIAKCDKIDICS
ncbi:MAG TPA: hypothetical protein VMZ91_14355 [Candidatus Paceibacterota bacterium]|nr:hypothetical protein [Candidatus Paceibacterota bacterium]